MSERKAVIVVYFGRFGNSVLLSLKTLLENDIDVYFFSDNEVNIESNNLFKIYIGKKEFNALVYEKMGFDPKIQYGYKLCDFKIFYPLIFGAYLKLDYFYIGFCDVDVVYGNLDFFIDSAELSGFDIIGSRGHFMLFNERSLRFVYEFFLKNKKVYDFVVGLLESKYHFAIDEFNFLHKVLERMEVRGELKWDREFSIKAVDINYFRKEIYCSNRSSYISNAHISKNCINIVHNDITEEVPYIHYQKRPFPLQLDDALLCAENEGFSIFNIISDRLYYKFKVGPFFVVRSNKRKLSKLIDVFL